MWQRFTERARKVVFYAQEEAGKLGENYVSTEHLLLGLVRENDSVAARILDRLDVAPARIRSDIERQVSRGDGRLGQDMQLTPRAKRVIDLAYDEARLLNNNYIGTEHLLLGMIREGEGLAGRILTNLGVDLDRTRHEVKHLQEKKEDPPAKADDLLEIVNKDIAALEQMTIQRAGASTSLSVDDPVVVQAILAIVRQAVQEKATDIFLWPYPNDLRLQYCVDGVWKFRQTLPHHVHAPLVTRLKLMADLPAEESLPRQEGRFTVTSGDDVYDVHVSFLATSQGERVAMSILQAPPVAEPAPASPETAHPVGKPSQRMAAPEGPSPLADVLTEHRLRGCDILGIEQLTKDEILLVLDVAARLKAGKFDATQTRFAQGQTLAMLFEKPSLRTRVTFEAGMNQLGGHAIYLEGRLGQRETVPDVARNLDRWLDGIMARTFAHQTVIDLAEYAHIPVINGLSDREHPCQAFADFQTLAERKGPLAGLKLAYVGDGNNVAHSLFLLAAKVGTHFSLSCPEGYEPDPTLWQTALDAAAATGATLTLTHDPQEGVQDADAVYTDVWASMGQEEEAAARAQVFAPFQVNAELVGRAKPDALIMHCLPAHRGEEITGDVIERPHSVVFDQAENRLHAQKAVLALVL